VTVVAQGRSFDPREGKPDHMDVAIAETERFDGAGKSRQPSHGAIDWPRRRERIRDCGASSASTGQQHQRLSRCWRVGRRDRARHPGGIMDGTPKRKLVRGDERAARHHDELDST